MTKDKAVENQTHATKIIIYTLWYTQVNSKTILKREENTLQKIPLLEYVIVSGCPCCHSAPWHQVVALTESFTSTDPYSHHSSSPIACIFHVLALRPDHFSVQSLSGITKKVQIKTQSVSDLVAVLQPQSGLKSSCPFPKAYTTLWCGGAGESKTCLLLLVPP